MNDTHIHTGKSLPLGGGDLARRHAVVTRVLSANKEAFHAVNKVQHWPLPCYRKNSLTWHRATGG